MSYPFFVFAKFAPTRTAVWYCCIEFGSTICKTILLIVCKISTRHVTLSSCMAMLARDWK